MQALILTAGEGKRIKPIITSKPFIPFCGQTLLDRVVSGLKSIGIKSQLIIANPANAALISSPHLVQTQPLGMADAVLTAKTKLSGPVVIVNGDDLIDPKIYTAFGQAIKSDPQSIWLTGQKTKTLLPAGYFQLEEDKITGIIEKPKEAERPSDYATLVLHYFPDIKVFIDLLETTQSAQDDVYEVALNRLLKTQPAKLVKAVGYFQPLKTPWQILDLTEIILTHGLKPQIHSSAKIHRTAVIEGPVQIEAGVKIMPYAVIKGPVFLGKNVVIGDHVLIRNSLIETGTVVGYKTEIARSYVGPYNNFHSNYVGDSIIETGSNLGAGATLANLRFDHQDIQPGRNKLGCLMAALAQLGVNVSVMPGVTIGSKAIVGSGLVLAKSLEAGEFKKD
ncbi:MAG: sugar phosphate nucleotidyltransferase [Candidatus Beckwithbacteria bacterium]